MAKPKAAGNVSERGAFVFVCEWRSRADGNGVKARVDFFTQAKFKYKQQQELIALQKRVQSGREEQKKQRQMDLERYQRCLIL